METGNPVRRMVGGMEPLLTAAEAAQVLGVAPKTLANWRGLQVGPEYVRVAPNRVGYRRAALEAYITQATCYPVT